MLGGLEGGSVVASGGKGGETGAAVVSVATARQVDFVFAVGAALALHVAAFVVLVVLALAEILINSRRELDEPVAEPEPAPVEEVIVELSPDVLMAMRVAPAPLPEPEPLAVAELSVIELQERPFFKTSEAQASEVPPVAAAFIGERDTVAGSESPPAASGPEVPNQGGEEQKRGELNLFDSSFNDGENPGDERSNEVQPEKLAGDPNESTEREGAPTEPEEAGKPKESLLNSETALPVPAEEDKKEETLPRESENRSEAEAAKRGEGGTAEKQPEEQPKKKGFRTESKKTRMEGTLNRRGRNSLDVENTAIGRYKASINRMIEREWQRQCINHRNHILPGILTLRFYVDERGGVSGLRFIDEFHASEIQKGFTIQSVRVPKFPVMPKKVAGELEGESLEFRLNFNF